MNTSAPRSARFDAAPLAPAFCARITCRFPLIQDARPHPMTLPARPADFMQRQKGYLPDHMGIDILAVEEKKVHARMAVQPHHLAPNGFLHAGSVVTLADTCCGYGCIANLPAGALSFTTVELKSNHLGTARDGTIECHAV